MALIYTDPNWVEQGYLSGAVMDFQEEELENSFTLEMGLDDYSKLSAGCCVYDEDNPQFGGVVRSIRINTAQNSLTWGGITFAGILSTKVIEPDSGLAYREITGTLPYKIDEVIRLIGLSSVFFTDVTGTVPSTWKIDRYVTALAAFRKLAEQNDLSMVVSFDKSHADQKLKISFLTKHHVEAGKEYDSDLFTFEIEKDLKPVNHLICLGSGQLENRMVKHLYADENGSISNVQTFTGVDEVTDVYDYSNVESEEELLKSGKKHFQELLDNGTSLEITPPDEEILRIGDTIAGRERISGIYVEKAIKKIIYKAQDDLQPSITYETTNTKG